MSKKAQPRIGVRRRSRECALQLLFQLDGHPPLGGDAGLGETLSLYWKHVDPEAAQTEETVSYAEEVVRGVFGHLHEVDEAIEATTQHWKFARMARVDRNIIRLATFELLFMDVPARIVINEAIELAKAFGTEESGAFVNGVLDRVAETSGR